MTPDEMREKAIDLFLKRLHCSQVLATVGMEKLGVDDPAVIKALGAFGGGIGRPARSYPSALPFFRLDRIYVRGYRVRRAEVHFGAPWAQISDHAALTAELEPLA